MQTSTNHRCVDGWPGVFPAGAIHCGMCGDRLIQFEVSPKFVLLAIPPDGVPVPASLVLDASRSLFEADLELRFNDTLLAIDGNTASPMSFVIPSTEQRSVTVGLIDTYTLANSHSEPISITLKNSGLPPQTVEVRIGRLPVINVAGLIFTDAIAGQTARAVGQMQHHGGLAVKITGVRFEPEVPGLSLSGLWLEQGLVSGSEVKFEVLAAHLPSGGVSSTLVIDFDLGIPPLRIAIEVRAENAEIHWTGSRTIFAGIDNELTLHVSNRGREPVKVERIEIVNQPAWVSFKKVKFPLFVAAQSEHKLVVKITGSNGDLAGAENTSLDLTAVAYVSRVGERRAKHTVRIQRAKQEESWVGIDFGTTSSCVAFWEAKDRGIAGTVRMLDFGDEDHSTTVPSVAYFEKETGRWLGGLDALELAEERGDTDNLIRSVKRLLNHPPNSPDRVVSCAGREFQPEEPATAILAYLRAKIEERLQMKLQHEVLTHPANFTDTGIKALLRCAKAAGLNLAADLDESDDDESMMEEGLSFGEEDHIRYRLDEPIAVAIRATQLKLIGVEAAELVLVYDFGGGTLDVSLLEVIARPDDWSMTVLSHRGANWLGGDDFTKCLVDLAAGRFATEKGYTFPYNREDLSKDESWDRMSDEERTEVQRNWRMLWDAAELAKVRLSSIDSATLSISVSRNLRMEPLVVTITAVEFEAAVAHLVDRSLDIVRLAVESVAGPRTVHLDDVDVVIASGKTSRIPIVRERLARLCGPEKVGRVREGRIGEFYFDVKECVAQGACERCHEDTTPLDETAVELRIHGLHQRTNCSYGIAKTVGVGAARKTVFHALVSEGISYREAEVKVTGTVLAQNNRQRIPLYQHTGNTRSPEALIIEGNPDVTFIDDIEVRMPLRRREGRIHVSMWLGKDGLLEAEALAEGSDQVFRPNLSGRSSDEKVDAAQ